jgi:hypothetical protein
MCVTDKYPTQYNLPIVPPPRDERRAPSITELEHAALNGVDLAEQAADPLNSFTLARWGVRLVATLARKARAARRG